MVYLPTHRDGAAMNGAPERFGWVGKDRQHQQQNEIRGISTTRRAIELSAVSIEMTQVVGGMKGQRNEH